jgi:hypothetical protein
MKESDTKNTLIYPISIIDQLLVTKNDDDPKNTTNHTTAFNTIHIWSNRLVLQNSFTLHEKGWQIQVIWKKSQICTGIGVYANANIQRNTILRIGILNYNLLQFQNSINIDHFSWNNYNDNSNHDERRNDDNSNNDELYNARLQYVQDYLWGLYTSNTDRNGYPIRSGGNTTTTTTTDTDNMNDDDNERFIGMWIPGNGLNHSTTPNTVYRIIYDDENNNMKNDHENSTNQNQNTNQRRRRNNKIQMIQLIALNDIKKGDELYDDYNRHGTIAPKWLQEYAINKNITLNFANHNHFV